MKTTFYALLASAALIVQAQAGGNHGSGGSTFAGPVHSGGFTRGGAPSFHPSSSARFGGGPTIYSGQRFSSPAFHSPYINSNGRSFVSGRRLKGEVINRSDRFARASNVGNRNRTGQSQTGNHLPSNWHNHVVAQHSTNWHRDWDKGRDHWWHGHHCRFINGAWFVFDFGFDPWWPYWGYPYDYYGYSYYPYQYDYYAGDYDQNGYADQSSDSVVATAQDRLAQQGYYRGAIDGVLGPETRGAIAQYQSDHGLRVTGALTTDTLQALGLPQVASY
jgi:Putative peptidoglycan binding domain